MQTLYHFIVWGRPVGAFERTLSLPSRIVSDKAQAFIEDGILTITLPISEDTRPETMRVKVK